jgi:protein-S-isoprenylcysteine O-methyltransferase Ste14
MKTNLQLAGSAIVGAALLVLLVFLPAGTFNYWQAWVLLIVSAVATWIPSIYLLRTNPTALQRRIHGGPRAEPRTAQKIIITAAWLALGAMFVVSVLDHRFGWSQPPVAVALIGDALVAIGLGVTMLVVIQNSHAAATVRVEADQKLVSTGLYGLVRHPMYTGNVILLVGIPLALGSYWGLVFVIPGLVVLALRIRDEETLLKQELDGYREYTQQVHYRLVPYIW